MPDLPSASRRYGSMGPRRPIVRPVSQVSLTLSDKGAFTTAIAESVRWLNARSRCDGTIPVAATHGDAFDLSHNVGAMPASAAKYEGADTRIWAAKLDYPDREIGQRTWSTEISISERRNSTNFIARLTNITRGDDPQYSPSVPGVVRNILEKLSVEIDDFPASEEVFYVDHNTQADFEYLLLDRSRRLPILAFSENASGECLLRPEMAINRLAGAAHVVHLSNDSSWQMTRTYGRQHSVFNGAARLYLPEFDPDVDEQFRHPLRRPSASFDEDEYLDWLCQRILPNSFVNLDTSNDLSRVFDVRALVSKKEREDIGKTSQAGQLKSLVDSLNISLKSSEDLRKEEANAAQALLDEAAAMLEQSEEDREGLADENSRLRAKLRALSERNDDPTPQLDQRLLTYDNFEEWADNVLGEHIEVTSRAIRETEKHGAPEIIEKFQNTLLLIRDCYVPMKLGIEGSSPEIFRSACLDLGIEESACFSQKNDIKNFPGYRATFNGRRLWLDRHFKFGNGTDLRRMFRIYYLWDEDTGTVVIGHMPTHLDNNVTN